MAGTGPRLLRVDAQPLRAGSLAHSRTLRSAIETLLAAPHAGVFLDFDGTLSPLQDDPETVLPSPGIVAEMEALATRIARVAVISGRNASFVHDKLGTSSRIDIYGLYGMEHRAADGSITVDPEIARWVPVIRSLLEDARRELPASVYVEDKHLSVALHYRRAVEQRAAVEAWSAKRVRETGVVAQPGRMVTELRPPVDWDKGDVVAGLISGLDVAWYFGDDLGDVPAFAVLGEQSGALNPVRFSVSNDSEIDELAALADFVLAAPDVVAELLAMVNARAG